MPPIVECPNFEILFSRQDAILSFSCEDLDELPRDIQSISWLADGWGVEFEFPSGRRVVRFPGTPEEVMARVSQHAHLLVVGLKKGRDELSPEIAVSKELPLPAR